MVLATHMLLHRQTLVRRAENQHYHWELWINYVQLLSIPAVFWLRVSPESRLRASIMSLGNDPRANCRKEKKKERFLYSNRSNVWSLYLEQSFVWGVLDLLEYRSASSCVRCMCPQLACCLLGARWDQMRLFDADLALAMIHSFQPSFCPFYSTPGSALFP